MPRPGEPGIGVLALRFIERESTMERERTLLVQIRDGNLLEVKLSDQGDVFGCVRPFPPPPAPSRRSYARSYQAERVLNECREAKQICCTDCYSFCAFDVTQRSPGGRLIFALPAMEANGVAVFDYDEGE